MIFMLGLLQDGWDPDESCLKHEEQGLQSSSVVDRVHCTRACKMCTSWYVILFNASLEGFHMACLRAPRQLHHTPLHLRQQPSLCFLSAAFATIKSWAHLAAGNMNH